jgi:Fe-S-cluster containining protein
LSEDEIDLLEQITGLSFDLFSNPKRKAVEEYFLQFKENGHCFFLEECHGRYFCSVYEYRPAICRKFPSTPIQKEACHEYLEKIRKQL